MNGFLEQFRPDESVARITEVDLSVLQAEGCQAILLDLDNTLLPWQSSRMPDDVREWIEQARTLGLRMCIVSNTHNPRRLRKIAEDLGVQCVDRALKPRKGGFLRAAEIVCCEPAECTVVGDQVLTDILGGNLAGMRTVLVKPMHRREFVGTKISRLIERLVLTLLRRGNRTGTKGRSLQSDTQESK